MTYHRPELLAYTPHEEHNRFIAQNPAAFVIGWVLDQQIKVQKAFEGPLELQRRMGRELTAAAVGALEDESVVELFAIQPALHRYSRSMGLRVRDCMRAVAEQHDGDPEQVWLGAADYRDFGTRLLALPGFGKTKVPAVAAVLARRFGLSTLGADWEAELFPYGSLSDVVVYQDLLDYQERKGAWKAARKAERAATSA